MGNTVDNIRKGILTLGDEEIKPGYTYSDFRNSKLYTSKASDRYIVLTDKYEIFNHKFIVTLFFMDKKLYSVSLMCTDKVIKFTDEPKRKQLHDEILSEIGLGASNEFSWGSIKSIYDARGNVSHIGIYYI